MFKLISKTIAAVAIVSVALFGSANAKTLKIETHFTASSPNGEAVSYTHLRAHETDSYLVCRLLLEKKK